MQQLWGFLLLIRLSARFDIRFHSGSKSKSSVTTAVAGAVLPGTQTQNTYHQSQMQAFWRERLFATQDFCYKFLLNSLTTFICWCLANLTYNSSQHMIFPCLFYQFAYLTHSSGGRPIAEESVCDADLGLLPGKASL